MIHVLQTRKTSPIIRMIYFAINYFHSIVGYQNPCPASLPYNILKGINSILAYSATNKSPVTVSQLCEMYNYLGSKTISLSKKVTSETIARYIFLGVLLPRNQIKN